MLTPDQIKELQQKDRQYVWHPFTQMKDYEQQDHLLIEKAEGIYLYDAEGNRYYDTISSWWVNVHGHAHPKMKLALAEQMNQMDHVMFSGLTHPPAILLAEQLVGITPPGLARVFYSDNGSTAVEVALKMAFQYWQHTGKSNKTKYVYMKNSYHGDTIGAFSVGGVEQFHSLFRPLLFEAYQVNAPSLNSSMSDPEIEAITNACIQELEACFAEHGEHIAAFIVEPILQAAGGMNLYPPAYLQAARKLCDQYEIHMIADEVATGFGRTGLMFACEHAGITPDFMCLSKGLTGGVMPLSATLCTESIYQAFYDDYETLKTFFHGHSFTGNPLACAVALQSLSIFKEEQVLQHVKETSNFLQEQFKQLEEHHQVSNIRGIGMICALDLYQDKTQKIRYDFHQRIGYQAYLKGLSEGLILRPLGDTLYYWLPLCTTKEQISDILLRTKRVLQAIKQ